MDGAPEHLLKGRWIPVLELGIALHIRNENPFLFSFLQQEVCLPWHGKSVITFCNIQLLGLSLLDPMGGLMTVEMGHAESNSACLRSRGTGFDSRGILWLTGSAENCAWTGVLQILSCCKLEVCESRSPEIA